MFSSSTLRNSTRPRVPTYRAGANLHDTATSGFSRVDIIGQEDLFPNEGYEFKPGRSKLTNSYRVSEDSPFAPTFRHKINDKTEEQKVLEQQMPQMIKTDRLCTKAAATAIRTCIDGELMPLHSSIAEQAVLKERQQQIYMNEQRKLAQMKDEARWAEIEQQEADATRAFYNRNDTSKRDAQRQLAEVYQNELTLHKRRIQEQQNIEKQEAEQRAKVQAAQEAAEKEKARQKKDEERKRLLEFEKLNGTMLQRKKQRQLAEMEIDKRVQKEHEQIEAKNQARQEYLQKIKDEKNKRREKIIQMQAKKLLEMQKKQDTTLENAVSELQKREEAERQAEIQKRKDMVKQRHDEWQESLKLREEKKLAEKNRPKTPEIIDYDEDAREFERLTRIEEMKRLRAAQKKQIEERKAREQKELEENLKPYNSFFLKDDDEW